MEGVRLELFVTGADPESALVVERIERFVATGLGGKAELEVIDVALAPERAARAECLVTPALVRARPAPERRLVGDLSDERAVLAALGLERVREALA
jgi:circadian clock protein KaiB